MTSCRTADSARLSPDFYSTTLQALACPASFFRLLASRITAALFVTRFLRIILQFRQEAEGEKVDEAQDECDFVATVGGARPDGSGVPDARGGRRPAHAHAVLQDRAAADKTDAGYQSLYDARLRIAYSAATENAPRQQDVTAACDGNEREGAKPGTARVLLALPPDR